MSPLRIVIPGGSGFLGRHMRDRLVARGDQVTVLTRGVAGRGDGWEAIHWDGATLGPWTATLDGADAILHLAGKRVDCRPTRRNIDELISSRVDSVRVVGEAWRASQAPPPVWVQLSSLARYGDGGETLITEDTPPPEAGPRQMVEVCRGWEAAYAEAAADVPRRVLLRPAIGIGGAGDPATERLVGLARMGLGGAVAGGRQWVSWIGLEDFLRVLVRALDDQSMAGCYHVAAPKPVRNSEMMAAYRSAVGRRLGLPSPRWVTTLGAWLLGSDPALALTGRRAVPQRLLDDGFSFIETSFADAVASAVAALHD